MGGNVPSLHLERSHQTTGEINDTAIQHGHLERVFGHN